MTTARGPALAAFAVLLAAGAAHAQLPDAAAMARWSKVQVVHYEVVGEFRGKHVQIPATDADLYADVVERVRISFDWDRGKKVLLGAPQIRNEPAEVSNLVGMERKCPTGKLNGAYEHFDVTAVKQGGRNAPLELVGKRVHPDTMVADSCSAKLRLFKGATKPVTEYIAPMDPAVLAYGKMAAGGIRVSDDGKSIVMSAQNSGWTWTYTPTPK